MSRRLSICLLGQDYTKIVLTRNVKLPTVISAGCDQEIDDGSQEGNRNATSVASTVPPTPKPLALNVMSMSRPLGTKARPFGEGTRRKRKKKKNRKA